MCRQKVCPDCCRYIPAHVWECTTNGCHHIFDECIPSAHDAGGVATIACSLMKPNGTILPHEEILCIDCQNWITWIIDYDAQLLLPSQT